MAVLQEYKCPCCDGAIGFDPGAQKLKCPYCDTEFEVQALEEYLSQLQSQQPDAMHWDSSATQPWTESDGVGSYVCHSCGGEILADAQTAATTCPYCGNPVVMTQQFTADLKPDLVIPFRLDKNTAVEALRKHCSGKLLLPKVFKDENRLKQIRGVYVPVWLFDAKAQADVRYRATQVRAWSDSRYNYTQTSYFSLLRSGSMEFCRVPVDGSSKMDDALMESIEPYDCSQAVDFHTAYLAGYLADKYDVDAQQSIQRANQRIKQSIENALAQTAAGYTSVLPQHSGVRLSEGQTRYALYPVWLLNTQWEGKTYTFAMNGQTGKFVGDLPVDKALYKKWFAGLLAGLSALTFALSYLLWLL